jgi:hypothetical protein
MGRRGRTLSHLININRMPQIFAASGYETQGGHGDQKSGQSDMYRVKSRARYGGMGANGINPAAGTRNVAGGPFLISVVKDTIGTGRG